MAVITLVLALLVPAWVSIKVLITVYELCAVCDCFLLKINISMCCLSAIKAANSKLCFTLEWVPMPRGQHAHINRIITVCVCVHMCMHVGAYMSVFVIILNYIYDFVTRYVSLIQIWRAEYTRTQLPAPPEEPVSPGQDQTERDGNGRTMGYTCRCCVHNKMNKSGRQ